jgi:LacI family transcriptional regulator
MSVSMKELAKLAGVSPSLVSRALHGGGASTIGVSAETAARIKRLATERGYRPNAAARATRRRRLGTVALLLSTERRHSFLPSQLLDGIQDALFEHDLSLLLARLPDEQLSDEKCVPRLLREWTAEGLLVNYTDHIPAPMLDLIRQDSVPAVWLNCKLAADCIHPDDWDAGRRATEYLLGLGHRMIAYVDYTHSRASNALHYSAFDRQAGYEAALTTAGVPAWTIWRDSAVPAAQRVAAATALLQTSRPPTAVITYSYREAGAVLYAASRLGRRIPEDLSVVTFGAELAQGTGLPVTTLTIPERALGRMAVQMLLARIAKPAQHQPAQAIAFDLVDGLTCAPPGA